MVNYYITLIPHLPKAIRESYMHFVKQNDRQPGNNNQRFKVYRLVCLVNYFTFFINFSVSTIYMIDYMKRFNLITCKQLLILICPTQCRQW